MSIKRKSLFYKSLLSALLALAVLALTALPALAEKPTSGIVRNPNGGNYVNLRDHPAYFGNVLARICLGTKVEIQGREGDWYAVRVNGCVGYMHSWFIRTTSAQSAPVSNNAWVRTYNGGRLNLRSYADTRANVLGVYCSGTRVTVLDYQPTWCKVRVGDLTGYMSTRYLSFGQYVSCYAEAKEPAKVCASEPARPAIDASVLVPAWEIPCRPETGVSGNPNLPGWQLAWGDPQPRMPENCFQPVPACGI